MTEAIKQQIEQGRVIAIVRGAYSLQQAKDIAAAVLAGGVTALEVTLNSPNALRLIAALATEYHTRMAIGAGTVLTLEEVAFVADAGGQFIVSPNRNRRVIEATKRMGLVSLPGCFTPSEIVEAMQAGADAVKLFPANTLGPDYVKAVRAPLSDVQLVPTGGVTPALAQAYRAAGAWAVGIGSELIRADCAADDAALAALQARATAFAQAMAHTS